MTVAEYTEEQLEKSDMFLFLKYVTPTTFKAFIRDETNPKLNDIQKTAESILNSQPNKKKYGQIFRDYLKYRFAISAKTNTIEVFDILISS